MFILFEGIDGSGKSSQARMLAQSMKRYYPDREIVLTREPGGTDFSEKLRDFIFTNETNSSTAESLLFLSARASHVEELIRPALEREAIVICDRFLPSTFAMQSTNNIGKELIQAFHHYLFDPMASCDRNVNTMLEYINRNLVLHKYSSNSLTPDITFFLKCSVKTALKRSQEKILAEDSNEDLFENRGINYFEKVSALYDLFFKIMSQEQNDLNRFISESIEFKVDRWNTKTYWTDELPSDIPEKLSIDKLHNSIFSYIKAYIPQ